MKKKISNHSKTNTYASIISIYIMICIVVLIVTIPIFYNIINKHDLDISNDMCGITAEKMSNSINYITESVKGRAEILSSCHVDDWEEFALRISENLESKGCNSIGLINSEGKVFGINSETEYDEFQKWNLLEEAQNSEEMFLSAPYRQGVTGEMVFTIFAPINQDGIKVGNLFMTFSLEEIQDMASSEILDNEMEIYLMNPYSNNYIKCFGGDSTQIGSWNNTKLLYDQINETKGKSFSDWEEDMRNGKNGTAIYYEKDDVLYTLVFVNLEVMKDWSVVVRIPNDVLSHSLRVFHISVIVLIVFLIVSLFVLFILSTRNANAERRMFEFLSVHDPLTGLSNRRAFEPIFDRYMLDMVKNKERGALIFLDVDNFKKVNDGYGHAMGDRILVEFAHNAEDIFGENSEVSRFGGDEFIVLVKGLKDHSAVESNLKEFRQRLAKIDFVKKNDEEPFRIHFSAGIVEIHEICTLDEVEKMADKALYVVKERGRDGYEWYS